MRPPFSMLRAAFLLLAAVIGVQLLASLIAISGCFWMIIVMQREPAATCPNVAQQVREVWGEALAAALTLIVASRNGKPPPSDEQ